MKTVLAILGNIFTSYLLIAGWKTPEMIGFVKNNDGSFIQPDTCIIQCAGWFFMFCVYVLATLYLVFKINNILFRENIKEINKE